MISECTRVNSEGTWTFVLLRYHQLSSLGRDFLVTTLTP
jgi:hypothetical protein